MWGKYTTKRRGISSDPNLEESGEFPLNLSLDCINIYCSLCKEMHPGERGESNKRALSVALLLCLCRTKTAIPAVETDRAPTLA